MVTKLIAFEGIDNCGKGTQIDQLANSLIASGKSVIVLRHAGEGVLNGEIRKTVLRNDGLRHSLMAELLLFTADLANLAELHIKPNLGVVDVIILDRWILSSLVYQGHNDGVNISFIEQLSEEAVNGMWPDLTIYIHIPPEVSVDRQKMTNEDQYAGALSVQQNCAAGYQHELRRRPEMPSVTINGLSSIEVVAAEVWDSVSELL